MNITNVHSSYSSGVFGITVFSLITRRFEEMWRFEAAHLTELMTMPGQGCCVNCQNNELQSSGTNICDFKSSLNQLNVYNKFRSSFRGNKDDYFYNGRHRMSLSSECGNAFLNNPMGIEKSSSFRLLNMSNSKNEHKTPSPELSKSANRSPVHNMNMIFKKNLPRVSITTTDDQFYKKFENLKSEDRLENRRMSSSKVESSTYSKSGKESSYFKRGTGKNGEKRRRTIRNMETAKYRVLAAELAHKMVVNRTNPRTDTSSQFKRRFTNAIPDVLSGSITPSVFSRRATFEADSTGDKQFDISQAVAATAALTVAPSSSDYVKTKLDEPTEEQKPINLLHLSPAKYPLTLQESPSKRPPSPRSPKSDKKLYPVPEENLATVDLTNKEKLSPLPDRHEEKRVRGNSVESNDSILPHCDSPKPHSDNKIILPSPIFNDLSLSDSSTSLEIHRKPDLDCIHMELERPTPVGGNESNLDHRKSTNQMDKDNSASWNVPKGLTDLISSKL